MRTIRGVIVTSPRILAALIAAATLAAFAVTTASARPQAAPNPPARLGAVAFTSARHSGQPASGRLATVADPLVSCGIGVGLFGEAIHLGGSRAPVVLAAIVLMGAGLVVLSRSHVAEVPEPVGTC